MYRGFVLIRNNGTCRHRKDCHERRSLHRFLDPERRPTTQGYVGTSREAEGVREKAGPGAFMWCLGEGTGDLRSVNLREFRTGWFE